MLMLLCKQLHSEFALCILFLSILPNNFAISRIIFKSTRNQSNNLQREISIRYDISRRKVQIPKKRPNMSGHSYGTLLQHNRQCYCYSRRRKRWENCSEAAMEAKKRCYCLKRDTYWGVCDEEISTACASNQELTTGACYRDCDCKDLLDLDGECPRVCDVEVLTTPKCVCKSGFVYRDRIVSTSSCIAETKCSSSAITERDTIQNGIELTTSTHECYCYSQSAMDWVHCSSSAENVAKLCYCLGATDDWNKCNI